METITNSPPDTIRTSRMDFAFLQRDVSVNTRIAAAIVFIYATNTYGYIYRPEITLLLKPLYWHLAITAFMCIALITVPRSIASNFPRGILIWAALYLIQLSISFLYSLQTEFVVEQLQHGIKTAVLLTAFAVILAASTDHRYLTVSLALAAVVSSLLVLLDFFVPISNEISGRAAGFFGNPNAAGKVLALSMVLGCAAFNPKLRLAFCVFVGVAILFTFSRSSWLLWVIGITGLAIAGKLTTRLRLLPIIVVAGVAVAFLLALWTGILLDLFYAFGLDRYLDNATLARIAGGEAAVWDESAASRTQMVVHALSEFGEHPIFGTGLGSTGSWLTLDRPHNTYLLLAVEGGIFGLSVFIALLVILWRLADGTGKTAVAMYAVSSIFAHTNLTQIYMLCLLAFIAVVYRNRDLAIPAAR